jgi:hypothetical protein
MGTETPTDNGRPRAPQVTQQDLERVLAAGRLLLSALKPEELDQLRAELAYGRFHRKDAHQAGPEIGNAGDS